jgi:hypothetical protein
MPLGILSSQGATESPKKPRTTSSTTKNGSVIRAHAVDERDLRCPFSKATTARQSKVQCTARYATTSHLSRRHSSTLPSTLRYAWYEPYRQDKELYPAGLFILFIKKAPRGSHRESFGAILAPVCLILLYHQTCLCRKLIIGLQLVFC